MGKVQGLIQLLDQDEMRRIHMGALRLLQGSGMRVDHEELLAGAERAGCRVDHNEKRVRFPERAVEEALARMRQYASDPTGFPPTHEPRRMQEFGLRTSGFVTTVRGLDDQRRAADLRTARDAIRLADALPYISHVGLPCSAQEVDPQSRTVVMAAELVKHTAKPGTVEAWTQREIEWLWEMAIVVRGSQQEAQRRPALVGYVGLRTPLCLDRSMGDVLIEYSRRGIPYMLYSMPCWASTAPATSAGVLVLGVAEVLAGLVLGQCVREGARPLMFIAPGALDMRSMLMDVSSPMRLNLSVAATQLISQFYGLPCACNCGKTAGGNTGVQAGYEKAFSILYPVLAGATSVGPVGQVENGFVFSFRQIVIDHEIAALAKHLLQGIELSQETLALDVIEQVGPGGNFLSDEHTVRNFRRELWVSEVGEWARGATDGPGTRLTAEDAALDKARRILASHDPHPLSKEQEAEIDHIVSVAQQEMRT